MQSTLSTADRTRQERVTGLMQLPAGTEISLRAEANKDLEKVIVHRLRGEKMDAPQVIELAAGDRRRFVHRLGELKEDQLASVAGGLPWLYYYQQAMSELQALAEVVKNVSAEQSAGGRRHRRPRRRPRIRVLTRYQRVER